MEATTKARLHGAVDALCGLAVAGIGFFAGLHELESVGPFPKKMLYAYGVLSIIGGHFVADGVARAWKRREPIGSVNA